MVNTAITVRFDPKNIYKSNRPMKNQIISKVQSQAPVGAASATVVGGWHSSRSDARNHITVDYYDDSGTHMSREHVV
ncbi:hypothetical protein FN846DRAFT_960941 [Sphaerosporella brunnea]|uniref:Uncharacterized protein n=1 Tax=Sphaerosporella brunnea TaxID=1250544 RepID=A0A5J5ENT5_9PEZI|nr:hypothetical protein FN846DRAFT_960941 [Sphaerosporella brunnea]